TISLWRHSSLFVTANREMGTNNWSGALQLVIPFGRKYGTATLSTEHHKNRGDQHRITYGRVAPTDGGLGWNFSQTFNDGGADYRHADITWRTPYAELRGGMYGASGDYVKWGQLSGSLVVMGGSAFAANRIFDSFVVVDTNGY